jgi:hypothetical protein
VGCVVIDSIRSGSGVVLAPFTIRIIPATALTDRVEQKAAVANRDFLIERVGGEPEMVIGQGVVRAFLQTTVGGTPYDARVKVSAPRYRDGAQPRR